MSGGNSSFKEGGARACSTQKPRRALSAYNLFYKFDRERLLAGGDMLDLPVTKEHVLRLSEEHKTKGKRAHRRTHGKITFLGMARGIAARWKALPAAQRQIFEDQAIVEKQNYEVLLQEWKTKQESNHKPTRAAPAAPASAPFQDETSSAVSSQNITPGTPITMPSLRCVSRLGSTGTTASDIGPSSAGTTNEDSIAPESPSSMLCDQPRNDPQLTAMRSRVDQTLAKLQETLNNSNHSNHTSQDCEPLPPSSSSHGLLGMAVPCVAADSVSFAEWELESMSSFEEEPNAGFDCSEPLDSIVLDHLFD